MTPIEPAPHAARRAIPTFAERPPRSVRRHLPYFNGEVTRGAGFRATFDCARRRRSIAEAAPE